MNNRLINAVALTVGAFYDYFKENEQIPLLPPGVLSDACNKLGSGNDVIYLLAAFAIALTKGMVENPGDIPAMCGGKYTAELVAAIDELRMKFNQ